MDPFSNINEARALATKLYLTCESQAAIDANEMPDLMDVARLCELMLELDQWRTRGGFDPYAPALTPDEVPNNAQTLALGRFLRGHFRSERPLDRSAHVTRGGMGLPDDYLAVRFGDGYEGGIAPDGSVST